MPPLKFKQHALQCSISFEKDPKVVLTQSS